MKEAMNVWFSCWIIRRKIW